MNRQGVKEELKKVRTATMDRQRIAGELVRLARELAEGASRRAVPRRKVGKDLPENPEYRHFILNIAPKFGGKYDGRRDRMSEGHVWFETTTIEDLPVTLGVGRTSFRFGGTTWGGSVDTASEAGAVLAQFKKLMNMLER